RRQRTQLPAERGPCGNPLQPRRKRARVTLRLLYLAAATTLATPIAVASASTDIGRPVAQVLREAESSGIRVIFTDQSVPPNMRVSVDSRVSEPVEHLRAI